MAAIYQNIGDTRQFMEGINKLDATTMSRLSGSNSYRIEARTNVILFSQLFTSLSVNHA